MAGTTTITQTAPTYICQSAGSGGVQLSAVDNIDVNSVAEGAFALVAPSDDLYRWYPADITPPGPGVIESIYSTVGRWILVSSPVPPASFYQTVYNTALNTAVAPIYSPTVGLPQRADIEFVNLNASDVLGVTTVTAWNQQIIYYNELTGGATVVENQRARLRFEQLSALGPNAGQLMQINDSAGDESTLVQFFTPSYQQVLYGANTYRSPNLKFQGTALSVTDDGTTTVVSCYKAASVYAWDQVLSAGNTTDGNDPTVNQADTLYLTQGSKQYVMDGASIYFATGTNQLIWDAGGIARIFYAGGGADAGGAPLILQCANHSGGNVGAVGYIHAANTNSGGLIRLSAGVGSAAASVGGAINMVSGNGTTDGGNFNVDTGTGAGGIGGFAVFNLGSGTTTGGGFQTTCGAGDITGGGFQVTTGSGPTSGSVQFTIAAGGIAGDFSVLGGSGVTQGSNINFTAGDTTVGTGGSITSRTGSGPDGGNHLFYTGSGTAGVAGAFAVLLGPGTVMGGSFSVLGGLGATGLGAQLHVYGGDAGVPGQPGYVRIRPYLKLDDTLDPADIPVGGGYLYSKIITGISKLCWKASNGTVTVLGPP